MTLDETMLALEKMGTEQTRKTFRAHGSPKDFFGVKIGDMKTLVKIIKKDHNLSMALFRTGNGDAQYLAGLIADEKAISKAELQEWVETAAWHMVGEYTVPWIAAESKFGFELGKQWILSSEASIASSGWVCLTCVAALQPDTQLDLAFYESCLKKITETIHEQPNRVKYCMNNFIIGIGGSIVSLTGKARDAAKLIGKVNVDVGDTSCKIPDAISYINKIESMGKLGNKKKTVRC